jgi:hypothetical protein
MGQQFDMIGQLYEKANRELMAAKNIEQSYKNLSHVRDIIYATSMRFKNDKSAFSVNKKLANAAEQIHYTIFHMCTFLYYETRGLREYSSVNPMILLDNAESRINAGMMNGKPLVELLELWEKATSSCRIALLVARKNLKNDKSLKAIDLFNSSIEYISEELNEAILINAKKKKDALSSKFETRYI